MEKYKKTRALTFLGITFVLLILLAASLSQLEFQAGRPFSLGQAATAALDDRLGPMEGGEIILLLLRGMLTLALVLFPIYILVSLRTPEGRRRLLANLLLMLFLLLVLNLLQTESQPRPVTQETQAPMSPLESLMRASSRPTDEFVPRVPPWLDMLSMILLAMLMAGGVAGLLFWWSRAKARAIPPPPLEQLAQKAQETIDALQAGADIKDTVIRSYVQMSQILQQERGIRRERAMTPHEFEQRLIREGLPPEPVHALTHLFEKVRYGHQKPGPPEERLAIESLQAIVAHCRTAGVKT